jgi:hypothetical protein
MLFFCLLAENLSLIYLNLSWNLIRSYASIALFRGFEVIILFQFFEEFDFFVFEKKRLIIR